MPPLNYDGASLVPDLSQSIRMAMGLGEQIKEDRRKDEVGQILDDLPVREGTQALMAPERMKRLKRLYQLDPNAAQFAIGMGKIEDERQLRAIQEEAETANSIYRFIDSENDPVSIKKHLAESIRILDEQGKNTDKLRGLIGLSPEQMRMKAKAHLIIADDVWQEAEARKNELTAGQREFESLIEGFSEEQKRDARLIKAGLKERAVGSAAITTAKSEGLTEKVAGSEAQIEGAKAGAKEEAKLIKQFNLKPEVEARVTSAVEAAKAQAAQAGEERSNESAFRVYETAMRGLSQGLEGTETGPIAGLMPTITANQQIAEGAVAAMAPILKQLFRSAGEGNFTDKDQELLLDMVPTRKDRPEARTSKLRNIDAIVRAKLGQPGSVAAAEQQSGQPGSGIKFLGFE